MNKATILNKLKVLDIHNQWMVSIVNELSNRRGSSALISALLKDTKKRLNAGSDPSANKKFKSAVAALIKYGLLYEKTAPSGLRLHLLNSVWKLENAIIESVFSASIAKSKWRKSNIQWRTILKEVRKELSQHNIKLPHKVTETLVRYFLLRRCGWKLSPEQCLIPPNKKQKKLKVSPERQQDLFI